MSEWISVDERLPEVSHREIACWNGKWSRVGFFLDSRKHGVSFFSPHDDRLTGITHWHPLPEQPK
jgi:hypothetical protein